MSGFQRRNPPTFQRNPSQGTGAASKAAGSRNNAARAAQQRIAQMMIGQTEDDYDYYEPREYGDRGSGNSGPIERSGASGQLAPVATAVLPPSTAQTRPRPPPVIPSRQQTFQPPMSPDSADSGYRRQLSGSRPGSRRYTPEENALPAVSREVEQMRREATKMQEEIDVLEEQNEGLYEKLREAEEALKESHNRCQELVKQVENLGGGVSIEARLLAKKEAALKQREAALKAATEQSRDVTQTELNNLRLEVEAAKEEAMAAGDAARQHETELKMLKQMTSKLMLTPEEKEEVALKRCWLARYWALAKHYDIHAEVATSQADTWQSYAALPMEVVLAAGLNAREDHQGTIRDSAYEDSPLKNLSSEVNIESMFQVEKGLRDLASLKIEDAVLFAMSYHRRPVGPQGGVSSEPPRLVESVELSDEEVEDVQFKQNWLVYFWRRTKRAGIEPDLADEKLQYWIARTNFPPKAHDAVDVERGLLELRKLGIESQLWEHARSSSWTETPQMKKMISPASSVTSLPNHDAGSPSV